MFVCVWICVFARVRNQEIYSKISIDENLIGIYCVTVSLENDMKIKCQL